MSAGRLVHSIILHRPIALILGYKIKLISPKHRRPDRHNLFLMNPQQYFFGRAIVRYRHLSSSIAYRSWTHLAFALLGNRPITPERSADVVRSAMTRHRRLRLVGPLWVQKLTSFDDFVNAN